MKVQNRLHAVCLLGLMAGVPSLLAETLTFQADSSSLSAGKQYQWNVAANWKTADGVVKLPVEGDDLYIDKAINNFHAANLTVYMTGIHFTPNAQSSGVSCNGFYLKAGGEGLIFDAPSDRVGYCGITLDGEVTARFEKGFTLSGGSVSGRSATQRGRMVKTGSSSFLTPYFGNYFDGVTIKAGTLSLVGIVNTSGQPVKGIDVTFADSSEECYLGMRGNLNFVDGAFGSSNMTATTYGVKGYSTETLTISGTPKVDHEVFGGGFFGQTSFMFAPSDSTKTFAFSGGTSTTTGSIGVRNGILSITNGASFTALNDLIVEETGILDLATDAGSITLQHGMRVSDKGGIRLNGQTFRVPALYTNGTAVAFGTYTSATLPDVILDEGTLVVDAGYFDSDPITFDVPENVTRTFAEAIAAYNEANPDDQISADSINGGDDKGRTIVKTGKGRLDMDTAISGFVGSVHVRSGVLYTACRYAIGKESGSVVRVRNGATFIANSKQQNVNAGRTFHIAGTGAGKVGSVTYASALYADSTFSGNYGNYSDYGATIVLDDDATVRMGQWMSCGSTTLTLNGHTLTAEGVNADDSPLFLPPTFSDNGHVVIAKGQWKCPATLTLTGTDPDNTITFASNGGWRFANTLSSFLKGNGAKIWKFIFNGADGEFYCDYNVNARDVGWNSLLMTTELNAMERLYYQGDRRRGYLLCKSPISGTGGFTTPGNYTVFLHLLAPNTFTGGFNFTRGTIWAYPNGAIPNAANAGKVRLAPTLAPYDLTTTKSETTFHNTFDGVAFMTPETYSLPDLEAAGTFASRVQCGQGSWRTITQKGKGLDYYSGLGATLLDVQAGYVKLPRGAAPGLWEGTNVCASASAASTCYAGTATVTNLAVRGPTSIIAYEAYNYTGWLANEVITYTGYVWNRGTSDATWSFALAPKAGSAKILVNGTEVVTGDSTGPKSGNAVLKPGANTFECRLLNAGGARAAGTDWPAFFGCAYDPEGRNDVTVTNNFKVLVDTGDGTIFTRTSEPASALPNFAAIRLASGTTLDLNGNRFAVNDIAGAGTISSSATDASAAPALVMNQSLTVNAAANETLSVAVPVEIGANFKVCVTNCANRLHTTHTLFTATSAVSGQRAITVESDDGKLWTASFAADGKSLQVRREGLILLLR